MPKAVRRLFSFFQELHYALKLVQGATICVVMCSCAGPAAEQATVEVGVFFGGQVQRLSKIEYSRTEPPKIGFRLTLPEERQGSAAINYEVVSIGPAGRRITRSEQLEILPERRRVDQVIDISNEARLGIINIRVTDGATVLADRALMLVERGK